MGGNLREGILASIKSASSSASFDSSGTAETGLMTVFLPALARAFLGFLGSVVDFSIRGVARQSLSIWKFASSASSIWG
jgi:hypothetical protein